MQVSADTPLVCVSQLSLTSLPEACQRTCVYLFQIRDD
jgi:hypothetical protein